MSDEEGRIVLEEKKEQAPTFVPKITGKFAGPPARRTFGPKKVFLGVGVVESTPTPEDSDVEVRTVDVLSISDSGSHNKLRELVLWN